MNALQSVLGFENDELGRLRLLDQGKIDYEPQPQGAQKLIVWDLKENRVIHAIPIPEEAAPARTSFLADLAIGNRGGFVYISDAGSGWPDHPVKAGIIVTTCAGVRSGACWTATTARRICRASGSRSTLGRC